MARGAGGRPADVHAGLRADPSDVDIPLGDPDTIPRNAVVPTSDFDEQGNALYRRSAKRGYEAKVWALLDYGCENGFRFRANG